MKPEPLQAIINWDLQRKRPDILLNPVKLFCFCFWSVLSVIYKPGVLTNYLPFKPLAREVLRIETFTKNAGGITHYRLTVLYL